MLPEFIGKFIPNRDVENRVTKPWKEKQTFYREYGVWKYFTWYRQKCWAEKKSTEEGNRLAQERTDEVLRKRDLGIQVQLCTDKPVKPGGAGGKDTGEVEEENWVSRDDFKGKDVANSLDVVDWVFDNLGVKDVKPEDAPSSGSYSYLKFLQAEKDRIADFYNRVWSKRIPSKSQIEQMEKFHDDGRDTFELLDRLASECSENETGVSGVSESGRKDTWVQDALGEPEVSPQNT